MDKEIAVIDAALINTNKALHYYLNIFARPNQEARIRTEAPTLTGLLAYKEYLTKELDKLNEVKPKRGNPNFGKNNPHNLKKKLLKEEVQENG